MPRFFEIPDFDWNSISNKDTIFSINGPFKWAKWVLYLSVLNICISL